MQRTFLYFAAFTGMGTVFVVTLIVASLIFGGTAPTAGPGASSSGATSTPAAGPAGEITITAFDLGFEPSTVTVGQPGTYTVTFVNDGGTFHDVTFADGTVIGAEGHQTATGEVTIGAEGMGFICSVPGHADGGMRGDVVVATAGESRADGRGDARHRCRRDGTVPGRVRGPGQRDPRARDPG
jgi:plastocyanin